MPTFEELIRQLEQDPETSQHLTEVRCPEVFDAWIRRCLEIGMPAESSTVAADLAMQAFPARDVIAELMEDTLERIKARWRSFTPEVREAYKPIGYAMLDVRDAANREVRSLAVNGAGTAHEVQEGLRQAIQDLRRTCEDAGEMMPCLLTWPA